MDRDRASSYAAAGDEFFRAAESAENHGYWNAAGLLLVHAAIAVADAVSIARRGEKSSGENHLDAVALLGEVTAHVKGREEALRHLGKIIEEKNRVSYTGRSFRAEDLRVMATHAERFRQWAEAVLAR